MSHAFEEAWISLVRMWQEMGVNPDPDELLTYKHLFVAGAVSYRAELRRALNSEEGDDESIDAADALDTELDMLGNELSTELNLRMVRH